MMKKFIFSFLTICISSFGVISQNVYAQSAVVSSATKKIVQTNRLVEYNLFEISNERDSKIDAEISNAVYLKLDKNELLKIFNAKENAIAFKLPLNGNTASIILGKRAIFLEDFIAQENAGSAAQRNVAMPNGVYYRGYEQSKDFSLAAISFFENEVGGIISIPGEDGNYNLVLNKNNPGNNNENYILFKEADLNADNTYKPMCDGDLRVNAHTGAKSKIENGEAGLSCKTVSIALYGDYRLFQKNSNNLAATQNYLTIVFNGVATLYENDNIRVALKLLNVNTTNDNYPTSSSTAMLRKFGNDIQTNTTANLMQFVTGYTTGSGSQQYSPLGGLAWLDVLCFPPTYYSNNQTYVGPFSMINTTGNANIPAVPVYSWDIECSTHEFGHNLGSPHTHACEWNGNGTAIDGCAPTYSTQYQEGNCPVGPLPTSSVKGTIMSYCHLLQNVGINFTNGFGPQPGALIRNEIAQSSCLSTNYMPTIVTNQASKTIIANAFCVDNNLMYCYDNKNDFDRNNDELVLIINNPNVASLNTNNLEIVMKTNAIFGTNTTTNAISYNYLNGAYNTWHSGNRTWEVKLNQTLGGTTKLTFPFLQQDVADFTGALPFVNGTTDSLRLVVYKTQTGLTSPNTVSASDVQIFPKGVNSNSWVYGTNANYHTATVVMPSPTFGATFAAGRLKPTSIGSTTIVNSNLIDLYPNPVNNNLSITYKNDQDKIQKVEVIDCLGRVVVMSDLKLNEQQLNVAHLASGVYFVKCTTSKGNYINKFVKN